jgi:hypothetical protein
MTITSKLNLVRTLTVLALFGTGWTLLSSLFGSEGSEGIVAAICMVTEGIISLAAAIGAALRPRQYLALVIAGFLTLVHLLLWVWILTIRLGPNPPPWIGDLARPATGSVAKCSAGVQSPPTA